MANRNSVTKLLPGNQLGSVLRQTAREARRSTRDPNAVALATEADLASLQEQVAALQVLLNSQVTINTTQAAQILALQKLTQQAIVVTPGGGVVTWIYPTPFINPPMLQATPQTNTPIFSTIFNVTNTQAQFAAWNAAGSGVAGITLHLLAYSRD